MLSPLRASVRSPAVWLLLFVFAAEFFAFDHYGSRRITGIYPRWNDQIQYLSECYTGFEYARAHGLPAGLWHALVNPSAQGTLHDVAAVIEFQFSGPSRSAALALGLLALIAWQAVLFVAILHRTRSSGFAFAAALLPLALRGPWENVPGSAYDFRLDHFALCAMGVTSAVSLLTARFERRGMSVLFGVAVGVTLLTRFITGTYFVVIFVALAAWILLHRPPLIATSYAPADSATMPSHGARFRRLGNLLLAGGVATAMALPIFWLNREWVWNYYYLGHYVGPESAIRNQNFGLGRSIAYVFGWLGERHLGSFFGWVWAAGTAAYAAVRWMKRRDGVRGTDAAATRGPASDNTASSSIASDAMIIGVIFVLGPALVLTLHPQKSEVVLSALAPGFVLLAIASWAAAAGPRFPTGVNIPAASSPVSGTLAPRLEAALAGVIVLTVLGFFIHRQTATFESPEAMANFRQVNGLADYVLTTAEKAKLPVIRVAVDTITDALDAQVLRVVCYERHHIWKDWDMKLPTGIAAPEPEVVRQRIRESDFVFLTVGGGADRFPYDRRLSEMRPELQTWCHDNLREVRRFALSGRSIALYQRPTLPSPSP